MPNDKLSISSGRTVSVSMTIRNDGVVDWIVSRFKDGELLGAYHFYEGDRAQTKFDVECDELRAFLSEQETA